jgi:glycosyltransferase involved in cell wall biosynthesis
MHIVMISDSESSGGAGKGTSRLAQGLVNAGAKVTRLVERPDKYKNVWNTDQLVPFRPRVWRVIQKTIREFSIPISHILQDLIIHPHLSKKLAALKPDVININNIHSSYLWPDIVAVCAEYAPVIWTLRDMWSFTGRCAYSLDCRKFLEQCDETCPTPNEYPELTPKKIRWAWNMRRNLLISHNDIIAISPSNWLADEAKSGLWKNNRVEIIPHGLPIDDYLPLDRQLAREALNVKNDGIVIGIAAVNLLNKRKGTQLLIEALKNVKYRPITLLTLGRGKIPIELNDVSIQSMGYIDHKRTMTLFYNALDIFIHPSLGEAWGHVVLEAMACGTPIIGFPTGGSLDMIRPDQTGWLAESISAHSLSEILNQAINEIINGKNLRKSCRRVVENEYSLDTQAKRYIKLINELM